MLLSIKKSAALNKGRRFFLILVLILPTSLVFANEQWSVSTSLSYSTGEYIYDDPVQNYIFYLGGRYSNPDLTLSMTLPFVMQRDNLGAQTLENNQNTPIDNDHSIYSGLSDLYIYGEYKILSSVSLTGQIKIPTATESTLFSSGEFDYSMGFAFRKMFGTFKLFADAGYLVLGDPIGFSYQDPIVYGIGVAKHATDGKSTVSFYYQGYNAIIKGLDPPRQISAAYFRKLSDTLGISFYGSKGFGNTTADYSLSVGFEIVI